MSTGTHTCGGRGSVPCPACTALGAQVAFVERWRAEHWDEFFDDPWICPLCNCAVQRLAADYPSKHGEMVARRVEMHQIDHGTAWQAYAALGEGVQEP